MFNSTVKYYISGMTCIFNAIMLCVIMALSADQLTKISLVEVHNTSHTIGNYINAFVIILAIVNMLVIAAIIISAFESGIDYKEITEMNSYTVLMITFLALAMRITARVLALDKIDLQMYSITMLIALAVNAIVKYIIIGKTKEIYAEE